MKKQGLLLIAGGLLALASCQNDANTGASDAQIDSMVNARVEELRMEMMMQNDSLINAMATLKADSICGAKTGGTSTSGTKKPSTNNTPSKPEPTKPTTIGNGKPRLGDKANQDPNTVGNGKPRMGDKKDQDANTIGNGKPKMGNNK